MHQMTISAHCAADNGASTPGEPPHGGHVRSPVARCEKGNSTRLQPSEHEVSRFLCIHKCTCTAWPTTMCRVFIAAPTLGGSHIGLKGC